MNILLVCNAKLPVFAYGGTERVVWDLAKSLSLLGHRVRFLAAEGSTCDFADIITIDKRRNIREQIPDDTDIVHFHNRPLFDPDRYSLPYIYTQHGNETADAEMPLNSVFVSANHAKRFGSQQFVHNGLDWSAYGEVDFQRPRKWLHFLGNAAWKVKNLKGAIKVAREADQVLAVMGGHRLNFKRGFRLTLSTKVKFFGMVGGDQKLVLLNSSRGLVFPVIWDEPFGLAIIESLYFGCPVFGSDRGSLPEIVRPDVGYLSNELHELASAIRSDRFDPIVCHDYAKQAFNAMRMTEAYLDKYRQVLSEKTLAKIRPLKSPSMTTEA